MEATHDAALNISNQRSLVPTTLGWRRIQRTRRTLLWFPWLGLAWQGFLAQSSSDWISAFLAASGAFLILFDGFRPQRLYSYPLSTLVVLGCGVTLQLGPLLFTAFEGNSLTFNLEVPVSTFSHGISTCLIAIAAHSVYRKLRVLGAIRNMVQQKLIYLRIFAPLDFRELLPMGALGLVGFTLGPLIAGQGESSSSVFLKFLEGFRFFATIPAVFLLNNLILPNLVEYKVTSSRRTRTAFVFFLLYALALVLAGMLRNSRATFIFPLSCLVIGIILYWLFGLINFRFSHFLAFCLTILVALPVVTDLATAMVMTRTLRGELNTNLSPLDVVEETLIFMEDRPAINRFRREAALNSLESDLSEQYVSNIFLARFANAKFPDNSLEQEMFLTSSDREEMRLFHWNRFISLFPAPLINLFGFSARTKEEVISISYGDKLNFLATRKAFVLGWLRSGHFFGSGMAAFGFYYFPLLFAGFIVLFPLVDSHALTKSQSFGAPPIISTLALTQLLSWFIISNAESVVDLLAYPLRGFLEPVLLYAAFRWIARPLTIS